MKITFVLTFLSQLVVFSNAEPIAPYKPYIPEDKGLDPVWVASLSDRGQQKVYQGQELELIAMPCGGIGAGQVEITGDGRICFTESVYNQRQKPNAGHGLSTGYQYLHPQPSKTQIGNGFAIGIKSRKGHSQVLKLDGSDFDDIRFIGEYPIARLDYRRKNNDLPVQIKSEIFSPFVPLSVRDSANPVTALRFTVENTSDASVEIDLGGWLENICVTKNEDQRVNRVFNRDNLVGVQLGLKSEDEFNTGNIRSEKREPIVFDNFENTAFSNQWTAESKAFGEGTLKVSDARFNLPVKDYQGQRIATSFHSEGAEDLFGELISEPFQIERDLISFKIGGGNYDRKTCINLLIGDTVVRTATGNNSNSFEIKNWDVTDLEGKAARLQIVDQQQGRWAFVMVDDILFTDSDPKESGVPYGKGDPGYGNLAISVLDDNASACAGLTSADDFLNIPGSDIQTDRKEQIFAVDQFGAGSVISTFTLAPNESKAVTFLISWYFPNFHEKGRRYTEPKKYAPEFAGHIYNNWYNSSADAAQWTADNYKRLYEQTELFRETYHDTTLPYWLANRITMPVSTLAAGNITIWENGRMYGYEGVGFCMGTCGHVYNFVTAISKLFPELERSVRLMQDYSDSGPFCGFSKTGRINFRGYGANKTEYSHAYASDAQSGYILKAYREHLMSPDNEFLDTIWEKVKLAIGYQIFKDGAEIGLEPNGVLECKQTFWDPMWYGPNPYNNTLYLAALRAAEEMAKIKGELTLAQRYHQIFEKGQKYMDEEMWNGEYYIHLNPTGFSGNYRPWNGFRKPEEIEGNALSYIENFNQGKPSYIVGTSCDAQQIFGQNWAHQLGLGYIVPAEKCRTAAASIFKYNWTPDISLVYKIYPPKYRTLAATGEGVLVNGSWPKVERQSYENIHDKDDAWTGLEYEAACDMINESLLDEALVVLKAIDDRYDAAKRNPWNEIEGSDHYSRAMHAWNILLVLSGSTCDGPAGKIGFGPKMTPDDFKSFFSAAQGWGTYEQKRTRKRQTSAIQLQYGQLQLKTLTFEVPEDWKLKKLNVLLAGKKKIKVSFEQKGSRITIKLSKPLTVIAGQTLEIEMR